jgi:hypothetical protein
MTARATWRRQQVLEKKKRDQQTKKLNKTQPNLAKMAIFCDYFAALYKHGYTITKTRRFSSFALGL